MPVESNVSQLNGKPVMERNAACVAGGGNVHLELPDNVNIMLKDNKSYEWRLYMQIYGLCLLVFAMAA